MKINNFFRALSVCTIMCPAMLSLPVFGKESPKLSDPEIASVAVVANQIDINFAKIAKERSKNEEVLKFAQTMTDDHTAIIGQAVALVKKLGVTPKDNSVSEKLLSDARQKSCCFQSLQKVLIKPILITRWLITKQ